MNAIQTTLNDTQTSHYNLIEATKQREIAETEAAMIIAKRFARDERRCLDRIIQACTRPGLAEGALYSYARGGTEITGPSIRLAEALAQLWTNVDIGVRELSQVNGESIVESFAWDIENNVRQRKVFTVKHERHTKQGVKKLTDPRDIYEISANQGARRLRACILGILPGDVVEAAVQQCEMTLHTTADLSPERVKAMLEAFESHYGVTREQIEKRIQRRMDSLTPALFVNLRKIFQSLKDGMSSPGDWFEVETKAKPKATVSLADITQPPASNTGTTSGQMSGANVELGIISKTVNTETGEMETSA